MDRRKVANIYRECMGLPRETGDYSDYVLDFRITKEINKKTELIKNIIEKSKNARFLIIDGTKLEIGKIWSILEAWWKNEKLSN